MKTLASSTLISCVLVWLAVVPGCGNYTIKDQYRQGVKTVFVPIWTRGPKVYRRDLEQRLSEAIVKRIELDTPYKTTTKDRADTELRGKITLIEQRVLSKNPETGEARELEVTFTLAFAWKDLRSGEVLAEDSNFKVSDNYIPHPPIREDFFQGSEAVINRVARRIVETMEVPW